MPISVTEMIKKAEEKGYAENKISNTNKEVTRPWQASSVKFNRDIEKIEKNIEKEENNAAQSHKQDKKPYTNHTQTIHETGDKPYTKRDTKPYTKPYTFNRIQGIQRKILIYIYVECKRNRTLISNFLSKKEISNELKIKEQSLNNSIQRLIIKKMLIRKEVLIGRTGATSYELPPDVYDEMLKNEMLFNVTKNNPYTNNDTKPYTKVNTTCNNSSSINNTTILPKIWENLDTTPLEEFGFDKGRLKQLFDFNDPDVVQESINHFAYGLKNNEATQKYMKNGKNPVNVLMGVLRKGGNWFEKDYESPKDKALRELVEMKKLEKEKRDSLINELVSLEFDDWRSSLTEEELKNIIPESSYNSKLEAPKTVALRSYYEHEILMPRLVKEGLL